MLVFTTRLPLKSEITEQDCLNLFVEWVKGSPHYHMESLCFNVDSHEDYEYTDGDVTFSVKYYKDEAIELAACRLHNRERNLTWDSDCIFQTPKVKTLLVQLNCHWADLRTDFPEVHKPYIIKMFIEKGYCSFDGNIPVTDTPIIAEESNYETFRDIMCGKLCYEMPVVYISKGYWGETAVSETYLARELSGVAHVFVEKTMILQQDFRLIQRERMFTLAMQEFIFREHNIARDTDWNIIKIAAKKCVTPLKRMYGMRLRIVRIPLNITGTRF